MFGPRAREVSSAISCPGLRDDPPGFRLEQRKSTPPRIGRALHERACDEREGNWLRLLVLSNCSTCVLWYFGSVLVMVTMWGFYSTAPAAGLMFLLKALAQMATGQSLHQINKALKACLSSGTATNSAKPVELMERGEGAEGDARTCWESYLYFEYNNTLTLRHTLFPCAPCFSCTLIPCASWPAFRGVCVCYFLVLHFVYCVIHSRWLGL